MALTPSVMTPLGSVMPEFSLPEPFTGKVVNSSSIKPSNIVLVMFICNHCPYVIHLADHISMMASDYQNKPVSIFGINSNNVETHPADSPENMIREVRLRGYIFPYLYDETQQTALDFGAACTPDFFLYNKERKLVYRGRFDASRPESRTPVTGEDLRGAINVLLEGKAEGEEIAAEQIPSMGCNIKWKPGNAPA